MFDIEIKYDRVRRGYVVADHEGIDNMGMRKWLLQTFSVNSVLHESQELKNRILLENIPSGQQHLTTIVDAMREEVKLSMVYQGFGAEKPSTFDVEPWCVKLFEQRWYMLGMSDKLRIYALDRIKALEPTGHRFKMPKKFNAEEFFKDYYGIIIGDEDFDVEPVVLKVDAWQSNYLRTLPLHHSQREVERNEEYSIFEYRLCPSFDFRQKLLSMGETVEVLAPQLLRDNIFESVGYMSENYNKENKEYKFRGHTK